MTAGEPYRDPAVPLDGRVADLLGRMTLEEKLAQLGSAWAFDLALDGAFDAEAARAKLANGIGQITRVAGATNLAPASAAELAHSIQMFLADETRLGIPAIVHEECLHGIMGRGRVCFPQSIGLAATWDPELVRQMAANMSHQLRMGGAHQALAPILDVTRDPRWGRVEETFGEDPYLVAEIGASYIRGLQGEPRSGSDVLATGKHMVGHGLPEGGLNHAPAHIGERELGDVFLYPFEAAVRDAGLRAVMHAYDDVDGVPCVASGELFTTILREEWRFDGLVVSDYGGIDEVITSHRLVEDRSDAAVLALEAGIDVELPSTACYGEPLARAVEDGRLSMETIDRSVARVLRAKIELGLFERPSVEASAAGYDTSRDEEARTIALDLARESIVVLENDGTLPLSPGLATIAVIGPTAHDARNLLGDYSHVAALETMAEARRPAEPDIETQLRNRPTILDAIREAAPGATVRYARGTGILDGDDAELRDAVKAATGADVAIVVVGERSGFTDAATSGEGRDRLDVGLPGRQAELVRAVAATPTPVILVVVSGRPLAVADEAALSAAVIFGWAPGEMGPWAIADVLFGRYNPGGKLPITVPRHVGQVPIYYGHKPSGGRSHWQEDYVDGSRLPLWPFGHGLSYTTFEVGELAVEREHVDPDGEVSIAVSVANTGAVAGDEVVQLYVRDVEASVTRPVLELRGFRRVHLEPGERRRLTFRLAVEQLAFSGLDRRRRIEPGRIDVFVGTSSAELPLRGSFEIVGETRAIHAPTRYFTATSVD